MSEIDEYDDFHTGVEHLTDESDADKGDAAVAASDLLSAARSGKLESA